MPFNIDWGALIKQIQAYQQAQPQQPYKIEDQNRNPVDQLMPINMPQVFTPNADLGNHDITDTLQGKVKSQNKTNNFDNSIHLNWDHILASQLLTGFGQNIANHSANSNQNAILNWNKQQFNPLNYLPDNPNVSQQAMYGMAKGGIHIKPENKGKFTEYKKRTGKTTEEALHSKDPHVRKMAQFAKNAASWHHAYGGYVEGQEYDLSVEEIEKLKQQGYGIEMI